MSKLSRALRFTALSTALTGALALSVSIPMASAQAQSASAQSSSSHSAAFEADRADILAMAGDYRVRFDMQESTRWVDDYEALDRKISGGHESVRVIEDTGTHIVLQHLLVVEMEDSEPFIVKHWRQDWDYEPANLLVYSDSGEWTNQPVDADARAGRWSQTVYQVDDSPRYAGIGVWETVDGVRQWQSNRTWRPLPRRDATRAGVPYDRFVGINRHSPTPDGWIHFQDNTKMGMVDGEMRPIVQEYVLNSYTRFSDYDVSAADAYWANTAGYWQAVRAAWDALLEEEGAIRVTEEGETGTVISSRLLTMGTEIHNGELDEADAIAEAQRLISGDDTRLAEARVTSGDY